jgi:hypothetical protein
LPWVWSSATQTTQAELEYEPLKGQDVSVWHYYITGKTGVGPDDLDLEPQPRTRIRGWKDVIESAPASVSTFYSQGG